MRAINLGDLAGKKKKMAPDPAPAPAPLPVIPQPLPVQKPLWVRLAPWGIMAFSVVTVFAVAKKAGFLKPMKHRRK